MKKLIASGCCVLLFQSFSLVSLSDEALEQANGRKVLVKAIAVIVNTDGHRKNPPKRASPPHLECPPC